ncbi:MAG TPA: choice-of-anchor tandem repeat GloVer-containing protein [Verrucomicrobiae bacterium]
MNKLIQKVHVIVVLFLGFIPVFQATAQTFTNLHNLLFADGANPHAGLIVSSNVLFGTTSKDGDGSSSDGFGTVFRMNTTGTSFTNLYAFNQGTDGGDIEGGVVLSGNTLYGTAYFGGASNDGCIFAIHTDGSGRTNIYNFSTELPHVPFYTNSDGAYPYCGLALSGNTLFGPAEGGGAQGWGTLFAINTNGTPFTNLVNFAITNGQNPDYSVVFSSNVLYGVTGGGGTNNFSGNGTIYRVNADGSSFTNLYYFSVPLYGPVPATNADGGDPLGTLALSGNTLYGVTYDNGYYGNGTIYKINTDGSAFTVIHEFTATNGINSTNSDGAYPEAGLLLWSNALYGTAYLGGKFGNGTVFKLNTDGSGFTTLYSFSATNADISTDPTIFTNSDGARPLGSLIVSGSTLYGTASVGGTNGFGTIFSITLPVQLYITRSGTNAILSWPVGVSGFQPQYATNMVSPVTWNTIIYSGTQNIVTNPITKTNLFFRLMHP